MLPLPRLRAVRMQRLMTQEELGKASGVSKVTIIRIESGQQDARLSTIRKLATALDIAPDELLRPAEKEEERKKLAA